MPTNSKQKKKISIFNVPNIIVGLFLVAIIVVPTIFIIVYWKEINQWIQNPPEPVETVKVKFDKNANKHNLITQEQEVSYTKNTENVKKIELTHNLGLSNESIAIKAIYFTKEATKYNTDVHDLDINMDKQKNSRLIDVTFDISGSIDGLNKKDASYQLSAINDVKNLLSQNIQPGDYIRVRFIGQDTSVVIKKDKTFYFSYPIFTLSTTYSPYNNLSIIKLYGARESSFNDIAVDFTASSREKIINEIMKFYDVTKAIKRNDGGSGSTDLIELVNTIIDQNNTYKESRKFESAIYIWQTDGVQSDKRSINIKFPSTLAVSEGGKDDKVFIVGTKDEKIREDLRNIFNPIPIDNIKFN